MTTTINASTVSGLVNSADTSGILQLQTASTAALTITAAQNVGIGVTTPAKPLSVYGGDGYIQMLNASTGTATGDGAFIGVEGGTTALRIVNQENDAISFSTNGLANERMRIDSSGNVLVGATSPYSGTASNLTATTGVDIGSSSTATSKQLQFIRNGSTGTAGNIYATAGSFSNYCGIEFVIDNVGGGSQAGYLKFNTTSSATSAERVRITSAGALLIGQTSPSFAGGLCLTKSAADSIVIFENSYGSSGAQNIRAILGANGNNTSSFLFVGSSASNDQIYIYGNGNVVNRNNSYGAISDIKLKENVVDASPKLNDVMQLKVRNFNFKTDPDSKQIGFIAQEFEEVFPSLIDNTTSPNDPDDVIKAIKTSVLLPILVKAIQELKAINDTQAETINALTARLVALEK